METSEFLPHNIHKFTQSLWVLLLREHMRIFGMMLKYKFAQTGPDGLLVGTVN
jgi:hypothetical protein